MSCSSTGTEFVAVMIVPTGIGAEIGGHAGDANPVARLLGAACDTLVVHPNVVNAADINEMPPNSLYVEGSILDRFLEGSTRLRPVSSNRILVAVNAPVKPDTINAVSAARMTLGAEAEIVELREPLGMVARMDKGRATGDVTGWRGLVRQVQEHEFDALAVATPIEVDREVSLDYLRNGGVNPWGGVEAKASRLIANVLGKPVAHAPTEDAALKHLKEVVDPRIAAEMVSACFLHCVLKGLHRAPRPDLDRGLHVRDVSCMVSPWGCFGRPHRACVAAGVPVIMVFENKTVLDEPLPPEALFAENYLEAAGMLAAIRLGLSPGSVRRPVRPTIVHRVGKP